jgi:hypothetical protein
MTLIVWLSIDVGQFKVMMRGICRFQIFLVSSHHSVVPPFQPCSDSGGLRENFK